VAGTNNIEVVNFLTSNIGATSADLVTYTPSGTGAVARSAASKFGDVVSVKDFGAVGDGVADDTAAIQAAITASANKAVYFPTGTYVVCPTANITITQPCQLFGNGTLLKQNAGGWPIFRITASDVSIDGLEFRGSNFNANPTTAVFGDSAIFVNEAGYSTGLVTRRLSFTNLTINGMSFVGIDVRYSEDVTVTGNKIRYLGYAGVIFESVRRGVIANNRISWIDSVSASNVYGITLSRDPQFTTTTAWHTQEVTVVGNVITDIPKWAGIDGHAPLNCLIAGNVVARCRNGMYAQYDSTLYAYPQPSRNVTFRGNIVIGRATLSENEIGISSIGNATAGYNENIVIEDNLVIGCGTSTGGGASLAMVYSKNSIIRNNVSIKAIQAGLSMNFGCVDCTIENNFVDGVIKPTASSSFVADLRTTNTGSRFRNNIYKNTTGDSNYDATIGIVYTFNDCNVVFSKNRMDTSKLSITGGGQRRVILTTDSGVDYVNNYDDLKWELETESCPPFTHTAVGGAPREATASQISNFRRLPASGPTAATTIQRVRVSYRSTNTTYQIAVRPNEGNAYTAGVYTVDGTNITASTSIPDIYITIEGIYWED
jgi:polygalacturonase